MKTLTSKEIAQLIQEKVQDRKIELGVNFTYYDKILKKDRSDVLCAVDYLYRGNCCHVGVQLLNEGWVNYRDFNYSDRRQLELFIRNA
jgi:hypothetical protein